MLIVAAAVLALQATPAVGQSFGTGGGPVRVGPMDHNIEIDAVHRAASARARALGLAPPRPRALPSPTLQYPLRLRPNSKAVRGEAISGFVDLAPGGQLREFTCGTRTYDGHGGVDYFLWPFSWTMMDKREVEIVAAAPGMIISKADGHFDRQCRTGNPNANHVIIRQDDGVDALYWHMKRGSVISKGIGSRVAAGDYLGLVGSSGNSTGPHLHLEFRTPAGITVDPYAGTCGDPRTSWRHQHEDAHTAILRVATHSSAPKPSPSFSMCGEDFPTAYTDRFRRGSTVYVTAYVRDQRSNTPVEFTILRPDGTTFGRWNSGTPPAGQVYTASYWWVDIDLPTTNARGQWTARVTLAGKTTEHAFIVGPKPERTRLRTRVTPSEVSLARAAAAEFRVVVRNRGTAEAVGCTLAPDVPLAAHWEFRQRGQQEWDSAAFDIPARGRRVLILSIQPKRGYQARDIEVPIRVFCLNANAPAAKDDVNIVTLSF